MQFSRGHKGFRKVGHILGCKIVDSLEIFKPMQICFLASMDSDWNSPLAIGRHFNGGNETTSLGTANGSKKVWWFERECPRGLTGSDKVRTCDLVGLGAALSEEVGHWVWALMFHTGKPGPVPLYIPADLGAELPATSPATCLSAAIFSPTLTMD